MYKIASGSVSHKQQWRFSRNFDSFCSLSFVLFVLFLSFLVYHRFPGNYFEITSSLNTIVSSIPVNEKRTMTKKGKQFIYVFDAFDLAIQWQVAHCRFILPWSTTFRDSLLKPEKRMESHLVSAHTTSQEVIEPRIWWPQNWNEA